MPLDWFDDAYDAHTTPMLMLTAFMGAIGIALAFITTAIMASARNDVDAADDAARRVAGLDEAAFQRRKLR